MVKSVDYQLAELLWAIEIEAAWRIWVRAHDGVTRGVIYHRELRQRFLARYRGDRARLARTPLLFTGGRAGG
jgi:hypothetical protein